MCRPLLAVLCLVAVLAVPSLAQFEDETSAPLTSVPSILGPTGAVVTPTTDVVTPHTFALSYHWVNDTLDTAAKLNIAPIEKLEVSATYLRSAAETNVAAAGLPPSLEPVIDELVFSVKYLLVEEDEDSPAVAIGVFDVADDVGQVWYGVISKRFEGEVPVTVNIGGAGGQEVKLRGVLGDELIHGFFGSITLGLHEDVDVVGEYDSSDVNFAVRMRPYEGLTLDLVGIHNVMTDDLQFGLGAAYSKPW